MVPGRARPSAVAARDVERRPFYELLGVELRGATQTIGADAAEPPTPRCSASRSARPLLRCERVTTDTDRPAGAAQRARLPGPPHRVRRRAALGRAVDDADRSAPRRVARATLACCRRRREGCGSGCPAPGWLRDYERSWLPRDVAAGLVLTALLVPAGMGYAEASGLPPITGLYATIVPLVAYAILGPQPDPGARARLVAGAADRGVDRPAGRRRPGRGVALAGMLAILAGAIASSPAWPASGSSPTCCPSRSATAT